jgi:hypothetical protein
MHPTGDDFEIFPARSLRPDPCSQVSVSSEA